MYPVSDAVQAALIAGYVSISPSASVLFNGEPVADGTVPLLGGRLYFNRTAARYAYGTATVGIDTAAALGLPLTASDPLTAYGYELAPVWTVTVDTDTVVEIPLGVYPIQRHQVDSPSGVVSLTLEDRSRIVTDARVKDVYQIVAGTNVFTAIADLVADGYPQVVTNFPTTTRTVNAALVTAQADRWQRAVDMARSIGFVLRFDRVGQLTAVPEPSLTDVAVLDIADGVQLAGAGFATDRRSIYNTVVAVGINASLDADPPRADVSFTSGPLAVGGGFNERTRFYSSPFISTEAHALDAAVSILNGQASMEMIPAVIAANPTLDAGDVVYMSHPDLEIDGNHIIDTMQLDLDPAKVASPITTRAGAVNATEGDPVTEVSPVSSLLVPDSGAWFGVTSSAAGSGGSTSTTGLSEWVTAMGGARPHIVSIYKTGAWNGIFTAAADAFFDPSGGSHAIPFLHWKINSSSATWADVAAGNRDSDIETFAGNIKDYGRKCFMSFHHEPEDNVGGTGWTASDYVGMWQRAVDICRNEGADNLVFVIQYVGY